MNSVAYVEHLLFLWEFGILAGARLMVPTWLTLRQIPWTPRLRRPPQSGISRSCHYWGWGIKCILCGSTERGPSEAWAWFLSDFAPCTFLPLLILLCCDKARPWVWLHAESCESTEWAIRPGVESWGPLTQTRYQLLRVSAWLMWVPGPGVHTVVWPMDQGLPCEMVFVYAPESTKSSPRHMHGNRIIFLLS